MARHAEAARILSTAFENQRIGKRYIAMVRGWPPASSWEVDHALKQEDAAADALPQSAHTSFLKLATLQLDIPVDRYPTTRAALVEAIPHTGRRHQIRRHLKHTSHPIIGDATHGKGPHNRWWAEHLGVRRLWLHAVSMDIAHPRTGEAMRFESPVGRIQGWAKTPSDSPCASFNADWHAMLARLPWLAA